MALHILHLGKGHYISRTSSVASLNLPTSYVIPSIHVYGMICCYIRLCTLPKGERLAKRAILVLFGIWTKANYVGILTTPTFSGERLRARAPCDGALLIVTIVSMPSRLSTNEPVRTTLIYPSIYYRDTRAKIDKANQIV